VKLLAMVERRLGLTNKLAQAFPDRRNTTRTVHSLADMFRAHMFAICCGYEDADDLDRSSAAFKLACWRLPDTGRELCFQPTLSRLENAPRLRDVIRLTSFLVDAWMDSYPRELTCIRMDDTFNVVHGHQQLSLFSAHHDERHFLPIQVYDTERSRPVVVILRSGRAPRCAPILRRLMAHSRALADNKHHIPRRRALCLARGHDLVRAGSWTANGALLRGSRRPGSAPTSASL
jgi:hypothetical protein